MKLRDVADSATPEKFGAWLTCGLLRLDVGGASVVEKLGSPQHLTG